MPDDLVCEAEGCKFTRLALNTSGFCPEHEKLLAYDTAELERELPTRLRLEVEFQRWCADNGRL